MHLLVLSGALRLATAINDSDMKCNLNGVYDHNTNTCSCLVAWRGTTCGELALLPATRAAGLHAFNATSSSWGGAVQYDGTRWQMFAAEMVLGCGINAWETNSRVVRASTTSLDTPFIVEEEIKPAFASEPALLRRPPAATATTDDANGWLLFSIGNSSSSNAPRPDCMNGYTPKASPPNGTGGNFKHFVPVEIASRSSLTGKDAAEKWKLEATIGNGDFNPSPLAMPNGSTLLMWRHLARAHMVSAPSWKGPFPFNGSDAGCPSPASSMEQAGCKWWHLFNSTVDKRGLEDPFMYVQPHPTHDGSAHVTYHALFHDHKSFGGHAYSPDGATWTFSSVAPYSNVINWTEASGGGSVALQRRERPHLVFDERGFIVALSTSAQPPPTATKAPPPGYQNDYSFTSIQPVATQPHYEPLQEVARQGREIFGEFPGWGLQRLVVGKAANRRQSSTTNHLSLLNYHFFAEIFVRKHPCLAHASLGQVNASSPLLPFPARGEDREFHGGRYRSEKELDAAFPNGAYLFLFNDSSDSGTASNQTVLLEKLRPTDHIPSPVTLTLTQRGHVVAPRAVAPDVELVVHWTRFSNGGEDPNEICPDLIFFEMGDCFGRSLLVSGEPFAPPSSNTSKTLLTYRNTSFSVPAALLRPGRTYQISVEQSKKVTSRDPITGVPALPCFETTTYLDLNTTGRFDGTASERCPRVPFQMDPGQTDRPARPPVTSQALLSVHDHMDSLTEDINGS